MEEYENFDDEFSMEMGSFEMKQVRDFDRIFKVEGGGSFAQHPCLHDGKIYVGCMDRNVYCIDAATGELVWKFTADGGFVPASPIISDGILYIGCYDHNFYALDAGTGEMLWKFRTDDKNTGTAVVDKGMVYFGSNDYNIYCLDARSGNLIWKFRTQGEVPSMPTVHGNVLLCGSYDRFLYCLDKRTGALAWKCETQGNIYHEWVLTVHDGIVYLPSFDNMLRAVDLETGSVLWKYKTGSYGGMHSSPLLHSDRLFAVNREGMLHALTMDGSTIWKFRINNAMTLIEINGDRIYFGSEDQNVYCVDIENGKLMWKYQTQGQTWWKPTVDEARVYFSSFDCHIYCLDKSTQELLWKFRGQGAPSKWPPPFESYELVVREQIDTETDDETGRKTYEIEGLDEENTSEYQSRITYQISTQYSSKGKYQIDSREEEF